jgi:hypothetical protein
LYNKLSDLPVGLHSLLSLKRLEIKYCSNISKLPERGLPPSLEELEVCGCSQGRIQDEATGGLNNEGSDFKLLINGGLEAKL